MTTPAKYAAAKHDLWEGLINVMEQMSNDEQAGKPDHEVVLLVGQRLQVLVIQVERVLRGM